MYFNLRSRNAQETAQTYGKHIDRMDTLHIRLNMAVNKPGLTRHGH